MKRKDFLKTATASVAGLAVASLASCTEATAELKPGEIQHTVMFKLASGKDSEATTKFLNDARRILSAIGSVKNFRIYKQVSPKTDFDFHFTMIFENQEAYTAYNEHPDHVGFVKERWVPEVTIFQEADFII